VVVEFGNPLYQPVIDRWVAGASMPMDSVRLAWRNTGQLVVWDSPVYEQFFETIRRLNASRPVAEQLRIVLGDVPIHWAWTDSATQIPREFGYRDPITLEIIEHEVLGRNRKALVVIGAFHLPRLEARNGFQPGPLERASLGDALAQKRPGKAFLVWTVAGSTRLLADTLGNPPAGSLFLATNPRLMNVSSRVLGGPASAVAKHPILSRQIDAVLVLGQSDEIALPSPSIYTGEYAAELRRRARILNAYYGVDWFPGEVEKAIRGEKP
jgi:hypothetical protein